MDDERYYMLENDPNSCLTLEERREGWHFCPEMEGILIGPAFITRFPCSCVVYE